MTISRCNVAGVSKKVGRHKETKTIVFRVSWRKLAKTKGQKGRDVVIHIKKIGKDKGTKRKRCCYSYQENWQRQRDKKEEMLLFISRKLAKTKGQKGRDVVIHIKKIGKDKGTKRKRCCNSYQENWQRQRDKKEEMLLFISRKEKSDT